MYARNQIHQSVNLIAPCYVADFTVIDSHCTIGRNTHIWNSCVIREGVRIGESCVIGHLVLIEAETEIGDEVIIQSQTHITKRAKIENKVFIGPCCMLINEKNIASHGRSIPQKLEGPVVKFGARLGGGVKLAPGVVVGRQAKVDMGSLVTRDIPDYEWWRGSPAKKVGEVTPQELVF